MRSLKMLNIPGYVECSTFFFALCLTPVLGPFRMGMVPSVPTLDAALLVALARVLIMIHVAISSTGRSTYNTQAVGSF